MQRCARSITLFTSCGLGILTSCIGSQNGGDQLPGTPDGEGCDGPNVEWVDGECVPAADSDSDTDVAVDTGENTVGDTGGVTNGDTGGDTGGDPDGDPPATDADGDGFTADEDCDDADPEIYPGAVERCNELDDDCDDVVDEELNIDADGDGFTVCEGDCDDTLTSVQPDAAEVCSDGLDNDCDGRTDYTTPESDGFTEYRLTVNANVYCGYDSDACSPMEQVLTLRPDESVLAEFDFECSVWYKNAIPDDMTFSATMDSGGLLTLSGSNDDDVDCDVRGGVCGDGFTWLDDGSGSGSCSDDYHASSADDEEYMRLYEDYYGTKTVLETYCQASWSVEIEGID
jgi:hypothetical protein